MKIIVNIDVPELEPAITFYCAALGLQHQRTLDNSVAELTGGSSVIYLLHNPPGSDAASTTSEVRRYSRHWTPVHLDFVVDDLEGAAARALKAGAYQESACVEWTHSAMGFVLSNSRVKPTAHCPSPEPIFLPLNLIPC